MMKYVYSFMKVLVITFSLTGIVLYFLFSTQSGLSTTVYVLKRIIPGKLDIEEISGRLAKNFVLKNLHYTFAQNEVTINTFALTWNFTNILNKQVLINRLNVEDVIVKLNNDKPQSTHNIDYFSYLPLLKHLTIRQADIRNIRFSQSAFQFEIKNASIKANNNGHSFKSTFDGRLRQLPLQGFINAHMSENQIRINEANLNLGEAVIKVAGFLKDKWDFQWSINIPQLNKIIPKYNASIISSGKLTGPKLKPALTATLHADNVKFSDIKIDKLNSDIKGLITISGSSRNPTISTSLDLINGQLGLPQLGIKVKNIFINAVSNADQTINLTGKFTTGNGDADFTGKIAPYNAQLPVHFSIQGKNLLIINLNEYKITATPNISLSYAASTLNLSGSLFIPNAKITPKSYNNIVSLPNEVVYINQPTTTLPVNLTMEIQVNLGNDIKVSYENLKTYVTGSVLVKRIPGDLYTGMGKLDMYKGKYQAFGKKLNIEKGRLIYTGNLLTNPGLDMRATKQLKIVKVAESSNQFNNTAADSIYTGSDTITVGVSVKGNLDKPNILLISDPKLSQEDILSYLYFGYPRSQISGASSLALLNNLATNANSGKGLSGIKKGVKNTLGLTQLSVGNTNYYSTETNQASNATTVNIGKQIGKKLSINYSIGIFNPLSIFSVRYQFNKHFSFQSQTSSMDTGADIFYEYERE